MDIVCTQLLLQTSVNNVKKQTKANAKIIQNAGAHFNTDSIIELQKHPKTKFPINPSIAEKIRI